MSARRYAVSCLWFVVCFFLDINLVVTLEITNSTTLPTTSIVNGNYRPRCNDDDRQCPTSKACYQTYQICDSYDDCGSGFDEIECPNSEAICQEVTGNSSAFQEACTRFTNYIVAYGSNEGEEVPATDGILYFNGPPDKDTVLDLIAFSTVDFLVEEFAFVHVIITPFSSATYDTLDSVSLLISDAVDWSVRTDQLYEIPLRSRIRVDPLLADSIRLTISYVADSLPSVSNPYRPPTFLNTTSFSIRYRRYYDQCANILNEGVSGGITGLNPCLTFARDYTVASSEAAEIGVYCEPRERVQVVYDFYPECFENPLPVQPWQTSPSTTIPTTTKTITVAPTFAPPCEEEKLTCPVSFGCYDDEDVCDSYDDCGTGFDESPCSLSDEEGTACQEVEQNATRFDTLCVTSTFFNRPYTSDPTRGVHLFHVPEFPRSYIDSIDISSIPFAPNLEGTLYAMFNITTTDQMGNALNTTVLTAELRVTFKGSITHNLRLRVPLPLTYSETGSIEVTIRRTPQAIPPSPFNPYEEVLVGSEAVGMNFVQYYDGCEVQTISECLRAAWDFRMASERASSMGLTCLPKEKTNFILNLYSDCFGAPSIVHISNNLTVIPGQGVDLSCVAMGFPVPMVRWVIPDMPEALNIDYQSFQTLSTGIAELTFTSSTNASQYRFECVAENYVGEARAVGTVVTLGNVCVEKLRARDRFQAASDLNQLCPSVQETSHLYNRQGALVYRPASSGLLYSILLPSYIFSFEYGNTIAALRISITVDAFTEVPHRRRRDVVPVLYDDVYFNIAEDRNDSVYPIYFTTPIQVTAYESLYIDYTSLDSSQRVSFPDGPILMRYLECTGLMDRVHNASCYRVYEQWRGLEEELVELGCAERTSPLFKLYQNCLGIADEPLGEFPLTIPEVKLYDNFTFHCPIAGSIQSQWMKKTSREDVLPFRKPSSILRFERFSSLDQGYYYCKGVGNDNQTLATEPVLLSFKDVITLGFSITFNRSYVDFSGPYFEQYASQFRSPIRNALLADPVIAQLLVGGRYGSRGYDLPNIINTRNGSTIVDYQASFASGNGTDLVEEVTRALRDNLRNSDEAPRDIIIDSIIVGSVSLCPESVYVGSAGTLTFPSVGLDQVAESVEHCAIYTGNTPLPRATRACIGDFISPAYWTDPIFSDCFSEGDDTNQVLGDIANAAISIENVTEYSSDLAMVTIQTPSITAEGLESIASSLENIVQVQDSSEEVTINVINTVNNVLKVSDEDFVMAIDAEAPTRILDSLENQVTLFQTQGDGSNLTIVEKSLAVVAVNIPKTTLLEGLGFATQGGIRLDDNVYNDILLENNTMLLFDVEEIPMTEFEAAIVIPSGILSSISFNDSGSSTIPVTFFVFQNSRLFQSGDQQNTLEPGRRQAVGSRIISATIEGYNVQNLPLGQEIETAFLELNVTDDDETVDARSCVFWDKSTSSGGQWSTEGCRREDLPGLDRIRCLCDHLTSFAVLLDVSGNIDIFALDVLSMIGCGVSALCLVILLVTFLFVKKLRSRQPQRIHINLCVALLGLYIVFMVGIDLRYPTNGCVAAGFILHFFLLSSMAWMLVEAVYMYLLFVKIHSGTVSKFLRRTSVLAWGSPLIVCIIIVCIDREFYLGDGTYCFVQPGPVLYYSVLLPIAIILFINTIIFVLVTYRLTCGRWAISANKSTDNRKKRSETWRRLQDLVAFTILLGLTWVFGFLAIGGARFIFNVLFLVFNSLQGLFIFIMFGLRQKTVREEWLRCLRCRCREGDGSHRSAQYMKSKPTKAPISSGQTGSTSGSDIPLDGRGSTTTASTVA